MLIGRILVYGHWSKSPPLEIASQSGEKYRPWVFLGTINKDGLRGLCFICPLFWLAIGWV